MTPPQRQAGYQSRDLSDTASMSGVGVLDRETPAKPGKRTRDYHRTAQSKPRRRFQHQAGSQQVLSIRGRRIVQDKVDPATVAFMVLATLVVIAGLIFTMAVTGITTQQSFRIQNLREQNSVLNNQLETLHRDLEDVSSTSSLAQRAADLGMVLPVQSGILAQDAEGHVVEQRAAEADTQDIFDVNSGKNLAQEQEEARAAAQREAAAQEAAAARAAAQQAAREQAAQEQAARDAAEQPAQGVEQAEAPADVAADAVHSDTNPDAGADVH